MVLQPFRLELEPRQAAVLDFLDAEAETFMGLRERLAELDDDAIGAGAVTVWDLYQHLDLVLTALGGIQVYPELVDLLELPDDRFDRPRIDVRAAHELHIVDSAADA